MLQLHRSSSHIYLQVSALTSPPEIDLYEADSEGQEALSSTHEASVTEAGPDEEGSLNSDQITSSSH